MEHQVKQRKSVLETVAARYCMEASAFEATIRGTIMNSMNVSREQFAAFVLVANEYNLNPLTKEIYAYPAKGGGIQPIVSIDGWLKIINSHPQFDGMEFIDGLDSNKLVSVTCKIYRKDRSHPTSVTEYMSECAGNSTPWKSWPARMLRHKATIQAGRYAFGFSGIVDQDEADRFANATKIEDAQVVHDIEQPEQKSFCTDELFNKNFPAWEKAIKAGKQDITKLIMRHGPFTEQQTDKILAVEA